MPQAPSPPRPTKQPSAAAPDPARPRPAPKQVIRQELTVSRFDQVSSFLLAFAMFIGIMVGMLFLLWITSGGTVETELMPPIIENPAGRGANAEGFERDFEPPGAEEVEELLEPTMEETLTAVTDAVSTVAASIDSVDSDATATTQGSGKGDSRQAGPEGEGDDIVPRFERWKLKFAAKNLVAYASQLDFYKIELAAIGGQIQGVDYASRLASAPQTRRGESATEKRLYFMWTVAGPLMQYDRQLLQKAGIPLAGRQMLKFVPPELENQLAAKELEYAREQGHQSVTEIAQTVFESQPNDGGYTFVVIDQRYRTPKKKP